MSEDQSSEKRQRTIKERTDRFISALDIDNVIAHLLVVEGFTEVEDIALVEASELASIQGFDADLANELQSRAKDFLEKEKARFAEEAKEAGISDDLASFAGLAQGQILELGKNGVKSLAQFADLASDELLEILNDMEAATADELIMKARSQAYGL
jgi:N utilization substance protein A